MLTAFFLACVLAQPIIELPPEPLPDTDLVRGLQALRLQSPGTVIGSYGQFNLAYTQSAPATGAGQLGGEWRGVANLERLVIFVSHSFTDSVHGYIELEWEDAFLAVEVEQAFVDWTWRAEATMRSGLVLVPMGIVNQWHEPPVFHGVKRPDVDTYVIPTTWRELGVGGVGHRDIWRYELYVTTAPDAAQMGDLALRFASTRGALTPANAYMVSGRIEAEPRLGVVFGFSGIAGDLGDDVHYYDAAGERTALHLPMWGAAVDARWRREGLEARFLASLFGFPKAEALMASFRADGSLLVDPAVRGVVPSLWGGAYIEVAYDVLRLATFDTAQQLLPFVRIEYYDTQLQVPRLYHPNREREVLVTTAGLSYRPLQQLVFKFDGQFRSRRDGSRQSALDLGMGYMF